MTHPPKPQPLTDTELDTYPGVMDLLQSLCALMAPDGPLSRGFYRDASSTVIRLCSTIAQLTAERGELQRKLSETAKEALSFQGAAWALMVERDAVLAQARTPGGTVEVCIMCGVPLTYENGDPGAAAICQGINPETGRDYVDGVLATCPIRAKALKEQT